MHINFSVLIRKDLRDLFEQLAISYRSMAVNHLTTKQNGVKVSKEQTKKPQKLGEKRSFLVRVEHVTKLHCNSQAC